MRARNGFGRSDSIVGELIKFAIKETISAGIDSKSENKTNFVYKIKPSLCRGPKCQRCVVACPHNALRFKNGRIGIGNIQKCIFCGLCANLCPNNCITVKS